MSNRIIWCAGLSSLLNILFSWYFARTGSLKLVSQSMPSIRTKTANRCGFRCWIRLIAVTSCGMERVHEGKREVNKQMVVIYQWRSIKQIIRWYMTNSITGDELHYIWLAYYLDTSLFSLWSVPITYGGESCQWKGVHSPKSESVPRTGTAPYYILTLTKVMS